MDWLLPIDSTKATPFRKCQTYFTLHPRRCFLQDILSNKCNLLSPAEITSSNFKGIHADLSQLKTDTNKKFDAYLTKLKHTTADAIFSNNSVLYYVNILHNFNHNLVTHNNRIERIRSVLHMKCRNFILGLHTLASNRIPESILHADVLSNILCGISQYLLKENK